MNNRYGSLATLVYDLDKPVGRTFGNEINFYRAVCPSAGVRSWSPVSAMDAC